MSTPPEHTPAPRYEPGGGKLIAVAVALIAVALAGMTWSFFSRLNAPPQAAAVKPRHLPPSARPATPAAPTAPTQPGAASPAPSFQNDKH